MVEVATTQPHQHEMRTVRTLLGLAVVSALIAVVAGLLLLLTSPESGSTAESALGLAAAIGGLATAGLAIAAAVYAQVKNLWQYAPTWVRVLAWALIAFAVITTVWSWIT